MNETQKQLTDELSINKENIEITDIEIDNKFEELWKLEKHFYNEWIEEVEIISKKIELVNGIVISNNEYYNDDSIIIYNEDSTNDDSSVIVLDENNNNCKLYKLEKEKLEKKYNLNKDFLRTYMN